MTDDTHDALIAAATEAILGYDQKTHRKLWHALVACGVDLRAIQRERRLKENEQLEADGWGVAPERK